MEATILDLRYKMRDVLKAMDRRETVQIKYHGKIKGEIIPCHSQEKLKTSEHPMFGMLKNDRQDPGEVIAVMRRSRYRDL
jgi:hypothetical protein